MAIISLIFGIFLVLSVFIFAEVMPLAVLIITGVIGLICGLVTLRSHTIMAIIGVMLNLYTLMFLGLFLT